MTITHTCESCGQPVAVPEQHLGRRLYCSSCQQPFVVPMAEGGTPLDSVCPSCRTPLPAGAAFCNQCGVNLAAPAARPAPAASSGSSGGHWALVVVAVCLAAVMVIGIIAAIAIPNLLNAIQRGRQKRTMADMRTIAVAVDAYQMDNDAYPAGVTSPEDLATHLVPTYLAILPTSDGWRNPFVVESRHDGSGFVLVSYGRDGLENPYVGGAVDGFDTDLIYEDGVWAQWPEGIRR